MQPVLRSATGQRNLRPEVRLMLVELGDLLLRSEKQRLVDLDRTFPGEYLRDFLCAGRKGASSR